MTLDALIARLMDAKSKIGGNSEVVFYSPDGLRPFQDGQVAPHFQTDFIGNFVGKLGTNKHNLQISLIGDLPITYYENP